MTGWQRILGRSLVALAAALAVVGGAAAAAPRPGSLDTRFGDDGRLTGQIGCVPLSVAGVERAGSGGGIRVLGSTEPSSPEMPGESGRLIMRGYDRRGRLDRDVGGTGTVVVPLPGGPAKAWGVARQPDGKLVVVGSVGDSFPDPQQDVLVARFYPDGSLDGEFGSGGVVTTDLGGLSESARDVVVQPDGRLVVAASGRFESGTLYPKRSTDLLVLRYTSAGTLDPDFASGGVLHMPSESDGSYFAPAGLAQGSDGSILVAGDTGLTHRDSNSATIARVRGDGSLDRIVHLAGDWDDVHAMSFDRTRRRIYLAGSSPRRPDSIEQVMYVAAVREGDLSPDPRFGTRGFARADFRHTDDDFATAVTSDTRGRVVLAGGAAALPPPQTYGPAPRSRFAIARFTAAGKLDRRFGRRGMARVGFPHRQSVAHAVLERPAGRLVLAGISAGASRFVRESTGCALAVARLSAR